MQRQKTYILAKAILERKDTLFGNNENTFKPQNLKEKEDAWEGVRSEMIDQGFEQFQRKSWRDVRNHDWQYLRRSAVSKYEHNQKPGVEAIPYNEVDKIVFEIMGNEPSAITDCVNGAIAASYNWLKTESPQHLNNISFDALSFAGSENGILSNAEQQQQQISTLLNSALAASASMLGRKMSWETCCSPSDSPLEKQQQQRAYNSYQPSIQQNNELEIVMTADRNKEATHNNGFVPNGDQLLQSIIAASASSTLPTHHQQQSAAPQNNNNFEHQQQNGEINASASSGIIINSSTSAAAPTSTTINGRKRQHSSSSSSGGGAGTSGGGGGGRSIEDEIQEARLKHILLQVKREELLVRQEQIKTELLERKLQQAKANNNDRSD